MNRIFLFLFVVSVSCHAQTEFTQYGNGLIYSESTMNQLGVIVDSLNLKFRSCDLSHPYYSYPQGKALWVKIPDKEALNLIESGISAEDFGKKYQGAIIRKDVWIIKYDFTNYKEEQMITYEGLPGGSKRPDFNVKYKKANDKISGWVINEEKNQALYVSLKPQELPFEYARLVQYVDCMIDTTASIYFPEAEGETYRQLNTGSKAATYVAWAGKYPKEPKYPDYDDRKNLNIDSLYTVYAKEHSKWDNARLIELDKKMKTSQHYKNLLKEAVEEALAENNSNEQFEFYVMRYASPADALKLKRSRKVIGGCSQDLSPRYHAMNICVLAAETAQWDIFLRSHLDIMNDRFERMSDGSYAYAGRKTYLQELEELGIPATDLLLGTTLRVSNVSDNHYWGSINRTGRALADARDKDALENRMLTMMQDEKLDLYNRLLIAFVFDHYVHNLEESPRKVAGKEKFLATLKKMPEDLQRIWKEKN